MTLFAAKASRTKETPRADMDTVKSSTRKMLAIALTSALLTWHFVTAQRIMDDMVTVLICDERWLALGMILPPRFYGT